MKRFYSDVKRITSKGRFIKSRRMPTTKELKEKLEVMQAACANCGCWNWIGGVDPDGYGKWQVLGEQRAHRVAWTLEFGTIKEGDCVLHNCDNRRCTRLDHLWIGTNAENMMDKVIKMRQTIGEEVSTAKLTETQVLEIRKAKSNGTATGVELAKMFGVTPAAISYVVLKKSWKHIP